MKLIVGLGNPGQEYVGTRHNIGYQVLAEVARRCAAGRVRAKFYGEIVEAVIDGEKMILLSPLTYMNKSGKSVQAACDYYQLEPGDVLVVCDDFNLELAKLRFRAKGSAGGQKGLKSIIRSLGTEEFPRLRIGIGPVPERWDVSAFVLSKFSKDERAVIDKATLKAAEGVECWVREGIEACMNKYNGS